MAFQLRYEAVLEWIGDGSGPVSVPSAQVLRLGQLSLTGLTITAPVAPSPAGVQQVPGGDSPTIANFASALTGATAAPTGGMALDLYNAINANLTRIQGFSSGGG